MHEAQLRDAVILTAFVALVGVALTLMLGKVALALYAPAVPVPLALLWLSIARVETRGPVPDSSLRFSRSHESLAPASGARTRTTVERPA